MTFQKAASQGHGVTNVTQTQNSTCVVLVFAMGGRGVNSIGKL